MKKHRHKWHICCTPTKKYPYTERACCSCKFCEVFINNKWQNVYKPISNIKIVK